MYSKNECLIATRSQGKIREIRKLLDGVPQLRILTLEEVGVEYSPAEDEVENYPTFRENALAKAHYFASLTNVPTIADDSGISVDALRGAPGVRSKRFAADSASITHKNLDNQAIDRANNKLLLERLHGLPTEARGAHYACIAALVVPGRESLTTIGTCSGTIANEERGTAGFGYDPIFLLPELGLTFAEIAPEEKNSRSHRARAFYALRAHLHRFLNQ